MFQAFPRTLSMGLSLKSESIPTSCQILSTSERESHGPNQRVINTLKLRTRKGQCIEVFMEPGYVRTCLQTLISDMLLGLNLV